MVSAETMEAMARQVRRATRVACWGVARDTKRTRTATAPTLGREAIRLAVSLEPPW